MEYANPQYLVEPDWLSERLGNSNVRVLDVTGMLTSKLENVAEERHFALGRIPGSTFLDVASAKGVLSDPDTPLPWMWPSKEHFGRVVSELGLGSQSHVVLYAATPRPGVDNGTMWSTRTWWIMHNMGLKCSILNGGWERWVAEGFPTSVEQTDFPQSSFTAGSSGRDAIVDKEELLEALSTDSGVTVVDALSEVSYNGQDRARYGERKGHITGAINLPMSDLVNPETGKFLEAGAMSARLEEAGLLSAERVITYCGGGIAATVDAFCLALMGHDNVAVYDASLFEWAPDSKLPMTDPSQ